MNSIETPFGGESVEIVDETSTVKENIGRDIRLDLRTAADEYAALRFPANRVFDHNDWFNGWMAYWGYDQDKIKLFQKFQGSVLEAISSYAMPMIRLGKTTTKEAVCLVFEKVNTGGKKLDAFELLTAMFAAEGAVNLRTDWYGDPKAADPDLRHGREARLHEQDVLKVIDRADFLRAVSLVQTFQVRREAEAMGRTGKDLPAISCNHAALLELKADAYAAWCEAVTRGYRNAAKFVGGRGLFWWKDVPYPPRITVLAAVFALRSNVALSAAETRKLERWFWCGVFGELYGSATDSRLANDVEDLIRWLNGGEAEPRTIFAATFSESRLDTLTFRISAAYKGVHALLMRSGARDFLEGEPISLENFFAESFDIHHIFPRSWCEGRGIPAARYDTIVNKSAISARTNRKIGGRAPSAYCATLDRETSAGGVPLDEILVGHMIDPALLRADDFERFYNARKLALLALIEEAMGKAALRDGVGSRDDYDEGGEGDVSRFA